MSGVYVVFGIFMSIEGWDGGYVYARVCVSDMGKCMGVLEMGDLVLGV